jgi:hypothetical protein
LHCSTLNRISVLLFCIAPLPTASLCSCFVLLHSQPRSCALVLHSSTLNRAHMFVFVASLFSIALYAQLNPCPNLNRIPMLLLLIAQHSKFCVRLSCRRFRHHLRLHLHARSPLLCLARSLTTPHHVTQVWLPSLRRCFFRSWFARPSSRVAAREVSTIYLQLNVHPNFVIVFGS